MANQRWRDRLLKELHRQGLPSSYVSRLVEELTDHATDLFTENPSMDAEQYVADRLGTPERLAAVAKVEFGRRTFAGRHPILTFLVGPIVTVPGTFIGTFLTVEIVWIAFAFLVDKAMGGRLSAAFARDNLDDFNSTWTAFLFCHSSIMRFVPFILSTWVFAWLGRRSGLRWWSMVACGMVAVIAVFFESKVTPPTAQSEALWMFGFDWRIGFNQILQAAVPLALGVWMLRRSSASRPKMLTA
jgi:hypothetical protein